MAAAQAPLAPPPLAPGVPGNSPFVAISLPDFKIQEVDEKFARKSATVAAPVAPPLGILSKFSGTFAGNGFNTIFRPNSGPPTTTTFPNPVSPPPPAPPSENVLELNLTQETLTFTKPLGSVPNRGLEAQNDIFLNGVSYAQAINDVTNTATGKADGPPNAIHFEPGLWMHVPATKTDPVLGESLVRMGSIPHGTTINAQGLAPAGSTAGPPNIPPVDITPFVIGSSNKIPFVAQTASKVNTPRIPQDLSKFIAAGTITQEVLTDPNTVLRKANAGKKIVNTTAFTVSTKPTSPELGGGTANIAFLEGGPAPGANADAAAMTATFWVSTVEHQLRIPPFKPGTGHTPLRASPEPPHPGASVPTFLFTPPHEIPAAKTITVTSTQIQYSQTVLLNFAGLSWPHVSVATLVPAGELPVDPAAWN